MDVTKIREVLIKAANEKKTIKKDKESGVSEFKNVMDNYKTSNEDEVKSNEQSQVQKRDIDEPSGSNDTKPKTTHITKGKDRPQETDDNNTDVPMLQSIILEAAHVFNLENSDNSALKALIQMDSQATSTVLKGTTSEGVSQLYSLLNMISEQMNNGQSVPKELVEGKLNELSEKFGLAGIKSFESVKQQLLAVIQGDKTPEMGSVKAGVSNLETIIRNELAKVLNNEKVSAENTRKSELMANKEFKLVELNQTPEQKASNKEDLKLDLDNVNLRADFKDKLMENKTSVVPQTASASDDKAEKLLKSLLSQDKGKGQSESVNDKLFNFLTQFDSVNNVNGAKLQEAPVVNRNTFNQDIIKAVKFMESSELKDLTVKIAPKELGEVIIKLTMDKGVMKASLSATNKEAYSILNSNLSDLNNKLNQSEIKIQEFSINIYNGDTTFFSEEFNRQNQQQQERRNAFKVSRIGNDNALDISENEAVDTSNVNILA